MEDPYTALQHRLAEFQSSGDPRLALDAEASRELVALRAAIGWPEFGARPADAVIGRAVGAIALAGKFALIRSQVLAETDRLDCVLQATELFSAVYRVAPQLVPGRLAGVCAALDGGELAQEHVTLNNEAIDEIDRGMASNDRSAVDHGIWLMASAVLATAGGPVQPNYLSHLGTAWMDRFQITGRAKDVDNAITAHRRALATPVPEAEDQAGHLANYGSALLARFEFHGGARDLDDAVTAAREAVRLAQAAPESGPPPRLGLPGYDRPGAARRARSASWSTLSAALLCLVELRGGDADLDEAVEASRNVAALVPAADPGWARAQVDVAQALLDRFSYRGQETDLAEAVTAAEAAASATPDHDAGRARCLAIFARAYAALFSRFADLRDLERAIEIGRTAVEACRDRDFWQAACLSNLGNYLKAQFVRTGDRRALDEAITMYRRAVQVTVPGHLQRRRRYLSNLGNALRARYDALGEMANLAESVRALEEAVGETPGDAAGQPGYVANLADALVQVSKLGDPGALDRAIGLLQQVVHDSGAAHPLRGICLSSLGRAWLAKHDASSDGESLDNAIAAMRQAVDAVPEADPRHQEYLAGLGGALGSRFERTGDPADAQQAIDASRTAAGLATGPALMRALAASDWGLIAAAVGDKTEAMNGFAAAVGLLDEVAWTGLRRDDQERQLGKLVALACDAAAWAISAGRPERAVELLEQGRGVLLAQTLDDRARYTDLGRAAPQLAAQLENIDAALGHVPPADDPVQPGHAAGLARQRAALADERDAVLARIRRLPGFAGFLTPPAFATLQEAAADGPVVIINVSTYRCDALTVTSSGVRVTPLAPLSGEDVVRHVSGFLLAVLRWEAELPGESLGKTIRDTLAWLWDKVIAPLLPDLTAACGAGPGSRRPRVWWCPTGPLTFLPLHAAQHGARPGDAVLDRFVSSYTPTLRLLRQARQRRVVGTDSRRPLVVSLAQTPGQQDLPSAETEADEFAARFPGAVQLRGPGATAEEVRRCLGTGPPWAHFACHGEQDISDPSAGHLALHDGRLRISEVSTLRLDGTELAFLSACETSRGGLSLADEAITIATAFQLAGYRHVIGTLWAILDTEAPRVAREVYAELDRGGIGPGGPGRALDAAVRALRRDRPYAPWTWASYIHTGP